MFDYVYKQRRSYFGYFGGGFNHGYKQQRTPLVAGIDNVYNPLRRLAGIWVRLGRAYLLFTFTTLNPVWQGCGGRILAGPRIKNVKYRIFDHYVPPVVTPRRQSCASERIGMSDCLFRDVGLASVVEMSIAW